MMMKLATATILVSSAEATPWKWSSTKSDKSSGAKKTIQKARSSKARKEMLENMGNINVQEAMEVFKNPERMHQELSKISDADFDAKMAEIMKYINKFPMSRAMRKQVKQMVPQSKEDLLNKVASPEVQDKLTEAANALENPQVQEAIKSLENAAGDEKAQKKALKDMIHGADEANGDQIGDEEEEKVMEILDKVMTNPEEALEQAELMMQEAEAEAATVSK